MAVDVVVLVVADFQNLIRFFKNEFRYFEYNFFCCKSQDEDCKTDFIA